jgi:hypothetical protein
MTVLATTELEAVNIMLAAIGEAPVATLEEDTIEDAQIALNTLRQVSKELQSRGWHFNTDYDYPLNVDGVTSKITYPLTAARVDAMPSEEVDVVKRGAFLYNRTDRTFLFTGTTLDCKIVWMFDFEDLPQPLRVYITLKAARRFAEDVLGDEATVKWTERDEMEAKVEWVRDDMRQADLNMLTGSYSTAKIFMRRRSWLG